jgi:hypothetical protein
MNFTMYSETYPINVVALAYNFLAALDTDVAGIFAARIIIPVVRSVVRFYVAERNSNKKTMFDRIRKGFKIAMAADTIPLIDAFNLFNAGMLLNKVGDVVAVIKASKNYFISMVRTTNAYANIAENLAAQPTRQNQTELTILSDVAGS